MLKMAASVKSDRPAGEIFSRINSMEKLLRHEKEFEEANLENCGGKSGSASVKVKIFGKEIKGRMDCRIGGNFITAVVGSRDIKYLKFGYLVENAEGGCVATQFVEFDLGSPAKNLFAKMFFSGKIKKHLKGEVAELAK